MDHKCLLHLLDGGVKEQLVQLEYNSKPQMEMEEEGQVPMVKIQEEEEGMALREEQEVDLVLEELEISQVRQI